MAQVGGTPYSLHPSLGKAQLLLKGATRTPNVRQRQGGQVASMQDIFARCRYTKNFYE